MSSCKRRERLRILSDSLSCLKPLAFNLRISSIYRKVDLNSDKSHRAVGANSLPAVWKADSIRCPPLIFMCRSRRPPILQRSREPCLSWCLVQISRTSEGKRKTPPPMTTPSLSCWRSHWLDTLSLTALFFRLSKYLTLSRRPLHPRFKADPLTCRKAESKPGSYRETIGYRMALL
jgi:hypothetical protein